MQQGRTLIREGNGPHFRPPRPHARLRSRPLSPPLKEPGPAPPSSCPLFWSDFSPVKTAFCNRVEHSLCVQSMFMREKPAQIPTGDAEFIRHGVRLRDEDMTQPPGTAAPCSDSIFSPVGQSFCNRVEHSFRRSKLPRIPAAPACPSRGKSARNGNGRAGPVP